MAPCLAEALVRAGGRLDGHDLMRRFACRYQEDDNNVTGRCFDIGTTTRAAIERFERTAADRAPDPSEAGNGTLMWLAPVAMVARDDLGRAVELAIAQSRTTHGAPVAHEACVLLVTLLVEALSGRDRDTMLRPRPFAGTLDLIAAGSWRHKDRAAISFSGYAVATLEASLWCAGRTRTFAEAVLLAANLGDDADTVAAVTGQLAGALYGREGDLTGILDRAE